MLEQLDFAAVARAELEASTGLAFEPVNLVDRRGGLVIARVRVNVMNLGVYDPRSGSLRPFKWI